MEPDEQYYLGCAIIDAKYYITASAKYSQDRRERRNIAPHPEPLMQGVVVLLGWIPLQRSRQANAHSCSARPPARLAPEMSPRQIMRDMQKLRYI